LDELRELAKKFSVQPAKLNRMMQTGEIGYCESCGEVEKFSERLDGSDNMRRDCKKCRAKKERVRRAGR
ncbi:MAG: hypothetical protein GY832_02635, partial [Chloroflexi bacterium]|nr:hypothetical protein [Chloroflexota bacterium]